MLDLMLPRGYPTRRAITLVLLGMHGQFTSPHTYPRAQIAHIGHLTWFDLVGLTAYPLGTLPSLGLLSPLTSRPCKNDKSKAQQKTHLTPSLKLLQSPIRERQTQGTAWKVNTSTFTQVPSTTLRRVTNPRHSRHKYTCHPVIIIPKHISPQQASA